ncbi:MAG: recombinase family protein, partial [Thalassovita sp.]|nr:recombinase family protein [Thalassovita sp.]
GLNRDIDPEQAEIVRRIFREFAAGKSTNAISTGLNLDHIPAPNGGSWESSSLRGNPARQEGILRNRLYVGIASVCRNTHSL